MVASHDRKKTRTKIEERGRHVCWICYDHSGDIERFIPIKTGQIILSRYVRWLNIMWNAYIKKHRRLSQNLEGSDSDTDSDYEDEQNDFHENMGTDVIREEEVDQIEDSKPTVQERRLGINIHMRGTREPILGATRSQTQKIENTIQITNERTC